MKILIVNLHSAKNLGDDAIMHATLRLLREAFPGVQITAAATDPQSWQKHPGLTVVSSLTAWVFRLLDGRWRGSYGRSLMYAAALVVAALAFRLFGLRLFFGGAAQRQLLTAYYEADLVASCGGGNFYAHRSVGPALLWALMALGFGVLLGKPIIMLPQSVGPIPGRFQRWLARNIFDRARIIWLREDRSVEFMQNALRSQVPLFRSPDMAFALAEVDRERLPARTPVRVGVTVMDWGAQARNFAAQAAYEDSLFSLLHWLATERQAQITVFCQCYGPTPDQDDRPAARRLVHRLAVAGVAATLRDDFTDARQAIDAYAPLALLIATRMHTAIFGFCRAVPVLLIGYQPKAVGVMATLGLQRYCLDIGALQDAEMQQLADELLSEGLALRRQIAARVQPMRREVEAMTGSLRERL